MLEGDSVPGGCFCTRRVILPNPTSSFNQSPNHSTLLIQNCPPNPGKTFKNPAVSTKPGGQFRPRRVLTSHRQAQPGKMRDHNALPRQHPLPEQFHPPNTGKAPQYRPQIPISGGHNRTWMVIPYPEGHNVTKRGAAGKRYERGLTGEADHGVPGVLLPSQPRHTSQPTKPPYRHKTTLPRHFHPPDSERKQPFRPANPAKSSTPRP